MAELTVIEVWRLREAWATEARAGKKRQENARKAALLLGVLGALLGSIAGLLENGTYVAMASALLIALGGYFGRELLTPERETEWARARILAEALKRECVRCLMGISPYEDLNRAEVLKDRCSALVSNVGLERSASFIDEQIELPVFDTLEDYIDKRPLEQAQWYEMRAREHQAEQRRYSMWTLVLGALSVAVGIIGTAEPVLLSFLPVITTATAALLAWIQSNRIGTLVSLYQETSTQLRLLVAIWKDASDERSRKTDIEQQRARDSFVERCEEILARENGAWRAEWLSEEKARESLAAFDAVTEAANNRRKPNTN